MTPPLKKVIVSYREDHFDVTRFLENHPGGVATLQHMSGHDVSERMTLPVPHSPAALHLLKEYSLGHTENKLEELVDWNRPMLAQVGSMGKQYNEWVNMPVDKPLRLFGPDYLEMLTKTPWWAVPLVWIPAIIYLMGVGGAWEASFSNTLVTMLTGVLAWTFVEYCLHRYFFHMNISGNSKAQITIHFLLHGLHHKVPFDPLRLVFPPFPAFILASLVYPLIWLLFPNPILSFAGGLIGYITYDMIHFYLHYGSPSENGVGSYFYHMKRYHNQHHFVHHDKGYGISSQMWDLVFGTQILLRRLGFTLKW